MTFLVFFAPPAAFLACAVTGILSHKSWGGILAASVIFYVLTYILMAIITKIMAERKPESN